MNKRLYCGTAIDGPIKGQLIYHPTQYYRVVELKDMENATLPDPREVPSAYSHNVVKYTYLCDRIWTINPDKYEGGKYDYYPRES